MTAWRSRAYYQHSVATCRLHADLRAWTAAHGVEKIERRDAFLFFYFVDGRSLGFADDCSDALAFASVEEYLYLEEVA